MTDFVVGAVVVASIGIGVIVVLGFPVLQALRGKLSVAAGASLLLWVRRTTKWVFAFGWSISGVSVLASSMDAREKVAWQFIQVPLFMVAVYCLFVVYYSILLHIAICRWYRHAERRHGMAANHDVKAAISATWRLQRALMALRRMSLDDVCHDLFADPIPTRHAE